MKNKILILTSIITIILTNLFVVFAEDNSSQNDFSWRYELTENLIAGDDITVFADGLEVPHSLILSLYQSGKLVDLSINDGESVTLTLPDNFSEENDWTLKAFVWDSLSSMIPLENSLEVRPVNNIDITDKFTDVNFLNSVRTIIGKNEEEKIYKSDVENITVLDIHDKDIQSLDGIEYFTALEKLDCSCNELNELNVSNSHRLREVYCYNNRFLSLDFSDTPELEILDCGYDTDILSLNISNNTALKVLACHYTSLTSLDISNAPYLTELYCYGSWLEQLDVSNNIKLQELECWGNRMTSLDVSNKKITSLDGIEYFRYLERLDFSLNTNLTPPDLSKNEYLKLLVCCFANLETLDLSNNRYLEHLDCSYNLKLKSLNIKNNTELKDLYCNYSKLLELDVTNNINLTTLACSSTQITQLDISNNINLQRVNCRGNKLTELNTSKNNKLTGIDCSYNNIETIEVSNNTELTHLYCDGNSLTGLDVSENKNLERLSCANNQMSSVDDVKGWENVGLILGDTFTFDPQRSIQ